MQGARLPPPAYRALQLHFHWRGPRVSRLRAQPGRAAPPHGGASVNLASTFPLASLLLGASGLSRFYRYAGSLTTRCCEPVVLWTVFEDAVPIGRAQVAQFRIVAQAGPPPPPPGSRPAPLTEDLRPQQPLGLRRVVAFPSASVRAAAPTPARGHGALLGLGLSLWL
ncbi:carbonic anhydrase 15-like [Balaenoptera musculus]|uniref:Carbonic anhydrase 15-like n=1 Tax=Balaenoptera musculus TaxID=9771 RepID=A0A8B8V3E4_BALMU|nr:carbonic anhydrase 15-like [Balaenoptera musculus]